MVIDNYWSFPQSPGWFGNTKSYQELDLRISTRIINVSSHFKAIVVLEEGIFFAKPGLVSMLSIT